MNQLTKLLAKSQGPVRVNCVAPGLVETRITEQGFEASHAAVRASRTVSEHGYGVRKG